MYKCPINPRVKCNVGKSSICEDCSITTSKWDDTASVKYINYQVGKGVTLDEVLGNLGYVKKLNPPNCSSHVKVPETRKEATLSDVLTELVKIKEILTVRK